MRDKLHTKESAGRGGANEIKQQPFALASINPIQKLLFKSK